MSVVHGARTKKKGKGVRCTRLGLVNYQGRLFRLSFPFLFIYSLRTNAVSKEPPLYKSNPTAIRTERRNLAPPRPGRCLVSTAVPCSLPSSWLRPLRRCAAPLRRTKAAVCRRSRSPTSSRTAEARGRQGCRLQGAARCTAATAWRPRRSPSRHRHEALCRAVVQRVEERERDGKEREERGEEGKTSSQ